MIILFDVTRLISSIKNTHATGIDRVEMNYFFYLVKNYENVEFILKFRNKYFLTKKQVILKTCLELQQKWKGDELVEVIADQEKIHTFRKKVIVSDLFSKSLLLHKLKSKILDNNVLDKRLIEKIKQSSQQFVYLNVSHANLENEQLFQELKYYNIKIISMLHDLIPITHPEFCTEFSTQKHIQRVQNMALYLDLIIFNSNDTRKQFELYTAQEKLNSHCLKLIAPLGTEEFNLKEFNHEDKSYFIIVGTIEPRKNHILLLEIWEELIEEMGENCPLLYIVGKRGWMNENVFLKLDLLKISTDKVIEINDITDSELSNLINNAKCMLMPTFVEGWCMPITEALARGREVICSDLDVLRESGQNIPQYIPYDDKVQWKNAIIAAYFRAESSASTQLKYQPVSWSEHLNKVFNQIEKIV